jgi:hypothetical protein
MNEEREHQEGAHWIPKGATPNLLFTFGGMPRDKNNLPLGPIMVVDYPDLYILVRDIIMEQQTLSAEEASRRCLDSILRVVHEPSPNAKDIFDIKEFYEGPIKVPDHEKKESDGPPNKKKSGPKE